ncbi:MAG: hypothetical protein RIT04_501 [Candidatus Parcubacteria bacterium]|jgi:aminoglycoside phosphotransferase family enzyme
MNIVEAFTQGKLADPSFIAALGATTNPKPHHITTTVSNIFVFEKKAYKIYRSDNTFFNTHFNNLSDKSRRFHFTRTDFKWNNHLSPEIYTELRGVTMKDGLLEFIEPTDSADELVIEMNRVDMSNQLMRRLTDRTISLEDCFEMGKQFGERLSHLPQVPIDKTAYADFKLRHTDMIPWVENIRKTSGEQVDAYLEYMRAFIESHRAEFDTQESMGVCIDVHAENVIFSNGTFLLMDTYAPKEAWLLGYKFINIYRLATDIYVFLGKEYFEKVLAGYEQATGQKIPRQYDLFLIMYSVLVQWPYQTILAEKEPWRAGVVEKYRDFVESYFSENA